MKIKLIFSVLTVFMYSSIVSGDISVQVFSCDEALSSTNMSKPRIYIHNNGTEQINNCSYRYYFSVENSKVPVWDNYYTPDETVTLEHIEDSLYCLVYTVNRTINPGENAPYPPGNSVGLHYNNWSAWDKSNDYSNNMQSTSTENNAIAVYVGGVRVYGTEPVDSGGVPPDSSIQLSSFALYSTEKSIVKDRSIFNGGGAIGSNGYVEIGDSSVIYGNIVSGGDALLRSHAQIFGDVTVGDSVAIESGVSVSGIIEENAELGTLSLPQKVISPGYNNVTVNQGQTVSISPGVYKDVLVMTGGTLNLEPGNYVFRDFILQTDTDVIFNMDPVELLEIDIQRNMEIADLCKVTVF